MPTPQIAPAVLPDASELPAVLAFKDPTRFLEEFSNFAAYFFSRPLENWPPLFRMYHVVSTLDIAVNIEDLAGFFDDHEDASARTRTRRKRSSARSAQCGRRIFWPRPSNSFLAARWLLALPPGAGLATIRGICKTAVGVPPSGSGVLSAGNGPAMRAAILGAAIDDVEHLRELVRTSTLITHRDPRAECGAFAVALAARHASAHRSPNAAVFVRELESLLPKDAEPLVTRLHRAAESAERARSVPNFAADLGLARAVTGYIYDTVPVALNAWLRHPTDLPTAVVECVRCGGDTDSVAAIAGGVIGAGLSDHEIPEDLLVGILDWPRTIEWMQRLAAQLESATRNSQPQQPIDVPFAAGGCRNLALLAIVLVHGVRRLLPPY